jgi:tetratricopeptide (TPR) repeat protein
LVFACQKATAGQIEKQTSAAGNVPAATESTGTDKHEGSNHNPQALMKQGVDAYQRQDFPAAIKFLSARVRLMPQDPDAYYYLGNSYVASKQLQLAAQAYASCVRLAPSSPAGQFALTALERVASTPGGKSAESIEALGETTQDPAVAAKIQQQIAESRSKLNYETKQINDHLQSDLGHLGDDPDNFFKQQRLQQEARNKIAQLQTRQWRYESRLRADVIDVRGVVKGPLAPGAADASLGRFVASLIGEGVLPKGFDPGSMDVPALLTIRDLAPAQAQGRAFEQAGRLFGQLKDEIERKQDQLDEQTLRLKNDVAYSTANLEHSPNSMAHRGRWYYGPSEEYHSQAAALQKQNQKKIERLQEDYTTEVNALISSTRAKMAALVK